MKDGLMQKVIMRYACAYGILILLIVIYMLSGKLNERFVLNIIVTLILLGVIPASICLLVRKKSF